MASRSNGLYISSAFSSLMVMDIWGAISIYYQDPCYKDSITGVHRQMPTRGGLALT